MKPAGRTTIVVAELSNTGKTPLQLADAVFAKGPNGESYGSCRSVFATINPGERVPCIWKSYGEFPRGLELTIEPLNVAAEPRPVIAVVGAKRVNVAGSSHIRGTAHNRSGSRLRYCYLAALAYRNGELVAGEEQLLSREKGENHPPDSSVMEVDEKQAFDLWFADRHDIVADDYVVVAGGAIDIVGPSTTPDGKHLCSKPFTKPKWAERASLSIDDALAIHCALETHVYSAAALDELGEERTRFLRTRVHAPILQTSVDEMQIGTFRARRVGDAVELFEWMKPKHGDAKTWEVVRARFERVDGGWRLVELVWRDEQR